MASWLSWLERRPVTAEVAGSSPAGVVFLFVLCEIAQLLFRQYLNSSAMLRMNV